MKKLIFASAAIGIALTASAAAQPPPKGTSYADCRANPDWWWVGKKTQAGSWKGTCRRKPGKFVKDGVDKAKKAGKEVADKAKETLDKAKKKSDGGGS